MADQPTYKLVNDILSTGKLFEMHGSRAVDKTGRILGGRGQKYGGSGDGPVPRRRIWQQADLALSHGGDNEKTGESAPTSRRST